ncbi:MAG: C-terminal helicase domain-containing protein [Pseudomonadota bacterium]
MYKEEIQLQKHGFEARPIHGDLAQSFRMETLQAFRDGELKLLVASDVAARGLDIPEVSHVFNFSVPVQAEDYVHRIGRTGRAGRKGNAIMMVCPNDQKQYDAVLRMTEAESIDEVDMGSFFDEWQDDAKPRRGKRAEKAKSKDDAPQSSKSSDRKPRKSQARRDGDSATPVVGFGDHVPAFLQIEA